jgi:hypothetical protein
MELAIGAVYGVTLEWMTLRQLNAYAYGRFLIMIDDAPLTIGVGWAVITYSAMAFSDSLQMPEAARPFLDVLLALNIDLAMDAIAIRLGMWHWGTLPLDQQWFGVPWVNFWAWFIVVLGYSVFVRALRPWSTRQRIGWLYAPAAAILALLMLAAVNNVYIDLLDPHSMALGGILMLTGSALYIVVRVRPRVIHSGPPDLVVIAVPVLFHLLYISAGLRYGFYRQNPLLALVGFSMLGIGLAVHLWPWWTGWWAHQKHNANHPAPDLPTQS